jgi:hypothetical protein
MGDAKPTAPNKPKRSASFGLRMASFFRSSKPQVTRRPPTPTKSKAQLRKEEEERLDARRKAVEAAKAAEEAKVEYRYGDRINPRPALARPRTSRTT